MSQAIILASSSQYRAQLLRRLGLPFEQIAADIDESAQPLETADVLALRLAREKAAVMSQRHPNATVIGSDQVAVNGDTILGKPGTADVAAQHLTRASGQIVRFYTGVSVQNGDQGLSREFLDCTAVHFRNLTNAEILRYIAADQPLDCAGSFKTESLGVTLFDKIESEDPTGLVGLPLIRLSQVLREFGFALP